jgi:hypothetical protein
VLESDEDGDGDADGDNGDDGDEHSDGKGGGWPGVVFIECCAINSEMGRNEKGLGWT